MDHVVPLVRPERERKALQRVTRSGRRAARKHLLRRTRECLHPGSRYCRVETETGRGLRVADFPEDQLHESIAAHAEALARDDERVLKRRPHTRITRIRAGERSVIVKEVAKGGLARLLADRIRGSAARRAWRGGHGLALRGVSAARPLAYLDARRPGRHSRSILILECVGESGADDPRSLGQVDEAQLAAALCRLTTSLHGANAHHGDLKANNIRLSREEGRLQACLIDFEGVRFPRRARSAMRIRELAQLNASLPDALISPEQRIASYQRYVRVVPFAAGNTAARKRIEALSLARHHAWRGERKGQETTNPD